MSDGATLNPSMNREPSADQLVRELVGTNIALARADAGLTQDQLAAQLGVARTQLSMWERGRRLPSARFMYAISDALGHERELHWLYVAVDLSHAPAAS